MYEFEVKDMSCGHCVQRITKAVERIDAGAKVKVDLPNRKISVESKATEPAIRRQLEEAGYPAT